MSEQEEVSIFSRIIAGEFGTEFVAESENVVAFNDINPQAPVHVLIVPRRQIRSVAELTRADDALLGEMIALVNEVAQKLGVAESGYRVLTNVGADAGQTVFHLHWHLLAGKTLGELA